MFVNVILVLLCMYYLEKDKNIPFMYTFALTMSALMLIFFIFTSFGVLHVAKIIWIAISITMFLFLLYKNRNERTKLFSKYHYVFIASMGGIFLLFYNGRMMGWDPFFWADFSKFIHMQNDFWSSNSSVFHSPQHQAYPPGFALFASVYMGLFQYAEYSQYLAFVTPVIFMFMTIIKLSNDYLEADNYMNVILVLVCFGLLKTLGISNPVNFLSADTGIAAFFTTCLLVAMFEKDTSLATIFLVVTLPAFTLLKSTCVLLSLTVVLIFLVRTYAQGRSGMISCLSRVSILTVLAVFPLLAWDHALVARSIASTSSHLNLAQVTSFFVNLEPKAVDVLQDLVRYFFLGPVIIIYPKALHPLTSTFALIIYSTLLFLLSYRKEKGRQLVYLLSLLLTFAGWLSVYVLVITLVLPDALADYIVSFTYPRYVGPFICSIFIVSLFAYILPHAKKTVHSNAKRLKVVSIALMAILPLYAFGIYQRAHPPILTQNKLMNAFREESETKWRMIDASQHFIIQNTPADSRIWTLLNESETGRHFVQLGFYLRPDRDNHLNEEIPTGMSTLETRRALLEAGVTHIFLLSPDRHPLQEFNEVVTLPQTCNPLLVDIRPWEQDIQEDANILEYKDAWWCNTAYNDAAGSDQTG